MTFRAERYPKNWSEIRAAILTRAKNRCETCGAPNHEAIVRGVGKDAGTYAMFDGGDCFDAETGEERGAVRGSEYDAGSLVRVILTVAHLDHDESNNDPANLKALCQMHHLRHDALDNARRRRATAAAKAGQSELPLFGVRPCTDKDGEK